MNKNKSLKVYINKVNEDWIIDRVRKEWVSNNNPYSKYFSSCNVVWLIAPWVWKEKSYKKLLNKKVICSIYHIDEDKFSNDDLLNFENRDKYVDAYHVISQNTQKQVKKLTNKKIYSIPFWINEDLWFPIDSKNELRKKYNIDPNSYLIGSFQRDTEGADLISPKLSKGPDRFLKIVSKIKEKNENIHILLAGKRRQYMISELKKHQINFTYYEMPPINELNELYNCLDLYIVSSRYEGGPQAIFECALTKTPIISTNVGVAPEVLSPTSIYDMSNFSSARADINYAFLNAQKYTIPNGFENFIQMFNEVLEDLNEK
tara:strand:+ start:8771 stop:9721 length:951 start_codon:yes stop_codon:yes gene_type:complete